MFSCPGYSDELAISEQVGSASGRQQKTSLSVGIYILNLELVCAATKANSLGVTEELDTSDTRNILSKYLCPVQKSNNLSQCSFQFLNQEVLLDEIATAG
ncbi:hypothetical protein RUM43_010402 [Polyplax serrata]|uniref:Uncharacterized protein n=1 Tax=Polyplax serrata TaxID=468196 RepID=A0AAN8P421_POLSC